MKWFTNDTPAEKGYVGMKIYTFWNQGNSEIDHLESGTVIAENHDEAFTMLKESVERNNPNRWMDYKDHNFLITIKGICIDTKHTSGILTADWNHR